MLSNEAKQMMWQLWQLQKLANELWTDLATGDVKPTTAELHRIENTAENVIVEIFNVRTN